MIGTRTPKGFRLWLLGRWVAAVAMLASGAHAQAPGLSSNPVMDPAVAPAPVLLNHPTVIDTAHLKGGDTSVTLFGIKGWAGDPARGLQSFVTDNGDRVTCKPHDGGTYACLMPTGLDVAETALANGAAETVADSPASYREQEAAAQAAHVGIWAGLPPASVIVQAPTVRTTAELLGDGRVFLLSGLIGFDAQYYTLRLQNEIVSHGNRLSCQQQDGAGHYVCVLPDGTDIATVALLEGLARVGPDATAEYRGDQAQAMAARSGYWLDPPQQVLSQLPLAQFAPPCCAYAPGDAGDGISYEGGVPVALVDGEPVFFFYDALLGFGFLDRLHRWHAAPERFRSHLDRFHPAGSGLRGLPHGEALRPVAEFHPPSLPSPEASRGPRVFNGPAGSGNSAAFHAPAVLGSPAGPRAPEVFTQAVVPRSDLNGARSRFMPGVVPFQRAFVTPLGLARPGPTASGGLRPGVVLAPRMAAPAGGFVGRH